MHYIASPQVEEDLKAAAHEAEEEERKAEGEAEAADRREEALLRAAGARGQEITVSEPNDSKLGYVVNTEQRVVAGGTVACDLIVHWGAEHGMVPLEIHALCPVEELKQGFRRWVVVQYPEKQARGKGPATIPFGDGTKSGWVCYLPTTEAKIHSGMRYFGRGGQPAADKGGNNKKSSSEEALLVDADKV